MNRPARPGQEPKQSRNRRKDRRTAQREDRAGLYRRRRHGNRPDQHVQEVSAGRDRGGLRRLRSARPSRPVGGRWQSRRRTGDFRRVLDRKDIDAVVVATPDHWHGIPTILACQAGKDVYCEKPLAHRIQEGRAMVRAAEKYKRVTQMGNLIHAGENYHRVVEIVRSGVLGKISQTRVWMAADRSGLGHARRWLSARGLRL